MPARLRHAPGPQALHFVRLAQGSPGTWVTLPGGAGRVILLPPRLRAQREHGWLLCLKGEAVVDLPSLDFVRLRVGEGFPLTAGWDALPTQEGTVLLMIPGC